MAERMNLLRLAMIAAGYNCKKSKHHTINFYFITTSLEHGVKFGIGVYDGNIIIIRFSKIDGRRGTKTIASPHSDAKSIASSIELLAHCAMLSAA